MQRNILHNLGIPRLTREQMGPEITERIRCARRWCQRHWRMLCDPDMNSRAKFHLYKSFVRPILTYGCELWNLNDIQSRKLLRFETAVLIEMYKSKYPHRHPKRLRPDLNAVYRRYRENDVVTHVKRERLCWSDLLKHEERALIKPRPPRAVHWWDGSHSSPTLAKRTLSPASRTSSSKYKEKNDKTITRLSPDLMSSETDPSTSKMQDASRTRSMDDSPG